MPVGVDFGFHFLDGAIDDVTVVRAVNFEPFGGLGLVINHVELVKLNLG